LKLNLFTKHIVLSAPCVNPMCRISRLSYASGEQPVPLVPVLIPLKPLNPYLLDLDFCCFLRQILSFLTMAQNLGL